MKKGPGVLILKTPGPLDFVGCCARRGGGAQPVQPSMPRGLSAPPMLPVWLRRVWP
jgi:hypothetical protein